MSVSYKITLFPGNIDGMRARALLAARQSLWNVSVDVDALRLLDIRLELFRRFQENLFYGS